MIRTREYVHVSVCWGIFTSNNSEEFWEITLFEHVQEFSREYMTKLKSPNFYGKKLQQKSY